MREVKPDSYITFVCDLDECLIERTTHQGNYDKSSKHYCSRACAIKGRSSIEYDEYLEKKIDGKRKRYKDLIKKFDKTKYSLNYKGG